MDALTNILHEISSKMYQESAKKGEQQPPHRHRRMKVRKEKKGEGGEEDIIDADYEVKSNANSVKFQGRKHSDRYNKCLGRFPTLYFIIFMLV